MKKIISFVFLLSLFGCATSPMDMRQAAPVLDVVSKKSFDDLSACVSEVFLEQPQWVPTSMPTKDGLTLLLISPGDDGLLYYLSQVVHYQAKITKTGNGTKLTLWGQDQFGIKAKVEACQ